MLLTASEIDKLNHEFAAKKTEDVLAWTWQQMGEKAQIGTSFQGAGLVMIDLAYKAGYKFSVFTLDTGYLFPETLELKKRIEDRYQITLEVLQPEITVAEQDAQHGPKLFETNPDSCCYMRKVEPLKRKLAGVDAWITGLRRNQADSRADVNYFELYEFDPIFNKDILKVNPMVLWKKEEVWDYIRREQIPYNPLHDKGYASIGCWPCTRPVGQGENERAGRWTGFNKTECGIHTFMALKKTSSETK
ncbi:MAG: phosphoadenylyl-sulfate reductase [Verrucomicrobiota bacterium]|nr:phosphoadenylyl-sulfate reductase [Verrucomicrobiota bacterium]